MLKVSVIFPRYLMDQVLIEIVKLDWVNLINIPESEFEGFQKEIPPELHRIHTLLDSITKLMESFGKDTKHLSSQIKKYPDEMIRLYSPGELYAELEDLQKFFFLPKEIENLKKKMQEYSIVYSAIKMSKEAFRLFSKESSEILILERRDAKELISRNLKLLGTCYEVVELEDKIVIFVDAVRRELFEETLSVVESFLRKFRVEIRRIRIAEKKAIKTPKDFGDLLSKLANEIETLEQHFGSNFKENIKRLERLWIKAQITNKILVAKAAIVRSEYTGILCCWIPEKKMRELEEKLKAISSSIIIIKEPRRRAKKYRYLQKVLQV